MAACSLSICMSAHMPASHPRRPAAQGNKTELEGLLTADGLFSGAAKVGFTLAPKDVRFKEMPWIGTVIDNAGALRSRLLCGRPAWAGGRQRGAASEGQPVGMLPAATPGGRKAVGALLCGVLCA